MVVSFLERTSLSTPITSNCAFIVFLLAGRTVERLRPAFCKRPMVFFFFLRFFLSFFFFFFFFLFLFWLCFVNREFWVFCGWFVLQIFWCQIISIGFGRVLFRCVMQPFIERAVSAVSVMANCGGWFRWLWPTLFLFPGFDWRTQ